MSSHVKTLPKTVAAAFGVSLTVAAIACVGDDPVTSTPPAPDAIGTPDASATSSGGKPGPGADAAETDGPTEAPRPVEVAVDGTLPPDRDAHACARLDDGSVYCWGNNSSANLGVSRDELPFSATPVRIVGVDDATRIAVGHEFSCAARNDNKVLCWGTNEHRELGTSEASLSQATPVVVEGLPATGTISDLSAGQSTACAVYNDGSVWCWGQDGGLMGGGMDAGSALSSPTKVNAPFGIEKVKMRVMVACGVGPYEYGPICWGTNINLQLGRGADLLGYTEPPHPTNIVNQAQGIAAGHTHFCTVETDGPDAGLVCWGLGRHGSTGAVPGQDGVAVPTRVPGFEYSRGIFAIAAGSQNTCVILADRTVECVGEASMFGQDIDVTTPQKIDGATGLSQMDVGNGFACAVSNIEGTARVLCWGSNKNGKLGIGTSASSASAKPVVFP